MDDFQIDDSDLEDNFVEYEEKNIMVESISISTSIINP